MPRGLPPLCFAAVVILFLSGASVLVASAHGLQKDALTDPSIARSTAHLAGRTPQPRATFAGLWRTDRHFEATLHLKNSLITGPLTVTPALIMADGAEWKLPPVVLDTAGTADVSLNRALDNLPSSLTPHLSQYGSVVVRYESVIKSPLIGYVEFQELLQGLSFVNLLQTHQPEYLEVSLE
jgi:hypothetical protein